MESVQLDEIIKKMNLRNLTPEIDTSSRIVSQTDVNRAALQLAGYFEHFVATRIQVIGNVEHSYINQMQPEVRAQAFDKFFSAEIPCLIFCRGLLPGSMMTEYAVKYQVPILSTEESTSTFMAELIRWLNVKLAPCITIHGVLVDVYGVGLLITGESGIGKSEAALELIKRGHRLVSDDVVEIRKVSDVTLIGRAPEMTKHLIELRGIGIIDVKMLFGVSSVRESQSIDLVIQLEEWDKEKEYDRMGLDEDYIEYLGKQVVCHRIPIRPGRNLAVICEAAAANHRQKLMGYNAALELYRRVQNRMLNKGRDNG